MAARCFEIAVEDEVRGGVVFGYVDSDVVDFGAFVFAAGGGVGNDGGVVVFAGTVVNSCDGNCLGIGPVSCFKREFGGSYIDLVGIIWPSTNKPNRTEISKYSLCCNFFKLGAVLV